MILESKFSSQHEPNRHDTGAPGFGQQCSLPGETVIFARKNELDVVPDLNKLQRDQLQVHLPPSLFEHFPHELPEL